MIGRDRVAILKAIKRRALLNILLDAKVRYRCVVDVLLKCRVKDVCFSFLGGRRDLLLYVS